MPGWLYAVRAFWVWRACPRSEVKVHIGVATDELDSNAQGLYCEMVVITHVYGWYTLTKMVRSWGAVRTNPSFKYES